LAASGTDIASPTLQDLAGVLGHAFGRPELLIEALTHRSAVSGGRHHRGGGRKGNDPANYGYERLEFLGDRVLGLVIADMLLAAYPHESEGDLARRHAQLVRKEALADVALDLGIAPHIRLTASEEASRGNANLLADVCEALIAALYLDGGLEVARRFVARHWRSRMDAAAAPPKDAKTGLQEWAQGRGLPLPSYALVSAEGPPHQPIFTVRVQVAGAGDATASGTSKRLAESTAAADLLRRLTQGTR
jgi:ribonuclease-3